MLYHKLFKMAEWNGHNILNLIVTFLLHSYMLFQSQEV